jgi:hypothetical protein
MQNDDPIRQVGQVDYPELSGIPDSDFPHVVADRWHCLPVVRIQAALQPVDLVAGRAAGTVGESANCGERPAQKHDGFHKLYIYQYKHIQWFDFISPGDTFEGELDSGMDGDNVLWIFDHRVCRKPLLSQLA